MGKIKKKYRTKRKRKSFAKKVFLFGLLILSFSAFVFSFLLLDPFYQIEAVEVSGNKLTPKESLTSFSDKRVEGFFSSRSLIFLNRRELKKEILDSYPHIESVEVVRSFPDRVEIKITEREKEAIWCNFEDRCFEVDFSGTLFKKAEDTEGELLIFDEIRENPQIGQRVIDNEKIVAIFGIIESLEDLSISKVIVPNREDLFLKSELGPEIRFSNSYDIERQLERLRILLSSEIETLNDIEYIELRYGSRVFYKHID